jgi:hypothetical protein
MAHHPAASSPCPDLGSFDLESSELTGCLLDAAVGRMTLQLRCPVMWWRFHTKLGRVYRWLKLDRLTGSGPIEFDVEIVLHRVTVSQAQYLGVTRS